MKVYIQVNKNNEFFNVNAYVANAGFLHLGYEVVKYFTYKDIEDAIPEDIVVGGIANVRGHLKRLGFVQNKEEIDYPKELKNYFGRKIWSDNLQNVFNDESQRNIFIKPKETKIFNGLVVKDFKDFIGLDVSIENEIWCSEPINFLTEWRCFVRYGKLLDVRYYKGFWNQKLDTEIVEKAIQDFKSAPAAYCLDFAIDEKGKYYLVEVNDGHSLGSYGMGDVSYAKFISARWAELTSTKDYLNF